MNGILRFSIRFTVWVMSIFLLWLLIKGKIDPVAWYPLFGIVILSEHHFADQISSMVVTIGAVFVGFFLVILYNGADAWTARISFVAEIGGLWGLFMALMGVENKIAEKSSFYSGEIENVETDIAGIQDEMRKIPGEIERLMKQKENYIRFSGIATRLCEILEHEKLLTSAESLGKELLGKGDVAVNLNAAEGDAVAKYCMERRVPVLVRNGLEDGIMFGQLGYKSAIACPVETNEGIAGFIQITGEDEFTDDDLRIFSVFSGLVSLSATNVRLFEKTKELAIMDSLTGLYVQLFFKERLEEEFKRASSRGMPLSVAIFDIDYFKKINDEYGHQCGDEILKQIGAILNKRARVTDIVARYGGEEFAIIMAQTPADGARLFAEEVRKAIMDEHFAFQPVGRGILPKLVRIKITVSAGVSALSGEEKIFLDLINKADAALYAAKKSGRNRVETWSGGES